MPDPLDTKFLNHAALVGYALSRALFEQLDGGQIKGAVASAALSFLPTRPSGEMPVDLQIWRDAEAELKALGGSGRPRSFDSTIASEDLNASNDE